jgi:hypothetical protein
MLEGAESAFGAPGTWSVSDMKIPKLMNESDISNPFNWGGRDRTCDLDVNSIPLLPLSYTPIWRRGVELNHLPEAYETSVQPLHFPTMMD